MRSDLGGNSRLRSGVEQVGILRSRFRLNTDECSANVRRFPRDLMRIVDTVMLLFCSC
ncbi:unnamed protein product [Musa hybrid cultivar]